MIDRELTEQTRRRYERLAGSYDRREAFMERRFRRWRKRLWAQVSGPQVLEVGIGTGKNIPFYPAAVDVTGIDLTPGMLRQAERRAAELGRRVDLQLGDVQALNIPDAHFDEAVSTFVFCSVPDPRLGLAEIRRVLRPGGRLLMLEHVRAANAVLALLMELANPVVVRVMGANINRRTVEMVQRSGWELERVEALDSLGIVKLIHARKCA